MHHNAPIQRHPAAFTLIELLVVISIIALLIGILLPALGAARQSARVIRCATQLQQLTRAEALYRNDFDGYHVVGRSFNPSSDLSFDDLFLIGQYDGRSLSSLGRTPTATPRSLRFFGSAVNATEGANATVYRCPLDDAGRTNVGAQELAPQSYGMTEYGRGTRASGNRLGITGTDADSGPNRGISRRDTDVTQPSNTLLFVENRELNASGVSVRGVGRWNGVNLFNRLLHPLAPAEQERRISHHRQGEGDNYAPNWTYADSHIETLDPVDTYEMPGGAISTLANQSGTQWDAEQ